METIALLTDWRGGARHRLGRRLRDSPSPSARPWANAAWRTRSNYTAAEAAFVRPSVLSPSAEKVTATAMPTQFCDTIASCRAAFLTLKIAVLGRGN